MNESRLEIPVAGADLSAPHFDDERTVAIARSVVPLAEAKASDRSKVSLFVLLGFVGAALSGAAAALAINHYEGWRHTPAAVTRQAPTPEVIANDPEPEPVVQNVDAKIEGASGGDLSDELTEPTEPNEPETAQEVTAATAPVRLVPVTSTNKPASDPSRLVRKRRVTQSTDNEPEKPPIKRGKRGAGRIQELFDGPNP